MSSLLRRSKLAKKKRGTPLTAHPLEERGEGRRKMSCFFHHYGKKGAIQKGKKMAGFSIVSPLL